MGIVMNKSQGPRARNQTKKELADKREGLPPKVCPSPLQAKDRLLAAPGRKVRPESLPALAAQSL